MHVIPGGAPPSHRRTSSRTPSTIAAVRAGSTDLVPHAVRAVTDVVNPLIADALALHFKLKSYGWQLTGPQVREYRTLFDECAVSLLAATDVMADRMRRIGATPVRSPAQARMLQRVPEEHEDSVPTAQMVARLLADEERVAMLLREAVETCTAHRDHATAYRLAAFLDEVERQRWLLFEMGRVGDRP